MASATAADAVSLTTGAVTLFDPGSGVRPKAWTIFNSSASSSNALVNVARLHAASEFVGIPPGASMTFANKEQGLGVITAKAVSTATISHGIAQMN